MSGRGAYTPLVTFPPGSLAPVRRSTAARTEDPSPSCGEVLRTLARPKAALLALSAACVLYLLVLAPTKALTPIDRQLIEVDEDPAARFPEIWAAAKEGWEEYEPRAAIVADSLKSWAERISGSCADGWAASRAPCASQELPTPQVDLVWTWTNGSADPLLRRWKAEVQASLSGRIRPGVAMVRARKSSRHFREHDELRYSVRSALAAFRPSALSSFHLLTADLPTNQLFSDIIDGHLPENLTHVLDASRIGQVPTWLEHRDSRPPMRVLHHSDIFEDRTSLPTFNSLSIESRMPNLPGLSDFVLYMNDDTFLYGDHAFTPSDVGAPFLGPVFCIQDGLTVESRAPGGFAGNTDGEWASLEHANWLLDRRFGNRGRGYLAHIPKAFSAPLLREVGVVWRDELLETSRSRFRGRGTEYQLPFLATHYVIEAHREALLHAFFAARSDRNLDGQLSLQERKTVAEELGFDLDAAGQSVEPFVQAYLPRRGTSAHLVEQLERIGCDPPGVTNIAFSSHDGFGAFRPEPNYRDGFNLSRPIRPALPVDVTEDAGTAACAIHLDTCFGGDFLSSTRSVPVDEAFRRVAYEYTHCGDCVVLALVGRSGATGLSAFLPSCSTAAPHRNPSISAEALFSLAKRHESVNLLVTPPSSAAPTCASARALAVRRILRYSYTLGDSVSRFVTMRQAQSVQVALDKMVEEAKEVGGTMPAFLTLNDDFDLPQASDRADQFLKPWFRTQWPNPSPYEGSSAA